MSITFCIQNYEVIEAAGLTFDGLVWEWHEWTGSLWLSVYILGFRRAGMLGMLSLGDKQRKKTGLHTVYITSSPGGKQVKSKAWEWKKMVRGIGAYESARLFPLLKADS